MSQHKRPIKTALALGFVVSAAFPAAASAHTPHNPRGAQPELLPQTEPVVQVVSASHGFEWGDAGVGAAGGFGLSMIALGGGLILVQRRSHGQGGVAAPAI